MIVVSELRIHPVKSLRGISVPEARVEERGLEHDRRWMLVDEAGVFLSQRSSSSLALFRQELRVDELILTAPDGESLTVPIEPDGPRTQAVVWDVPCDAVAYGDEVSLRISEKIGQMTRLVKMAHGFRRSVREKSGRADAPVSFADACPVLVAGAGSMDDLNARMERPLEITRFRPNIVVRGASPFEEDAWSTLVIGDVQFRPAHRCGRCLVTTIDPNTGEMGQEPLRTLATYRKTDSHVYFGMYYIPVTEGVVKVGDRCTTA